MGWHWRSPSILLLKNSPSSGLVHWCARPSPSKKMMETDLTSRFYLQCATPSAYTSSTSSSHSSNQSSTRHSQKVTTWKMGSLHFLRRMTRNSALSSGDCPNSNSGIALQELLPLRLFARGLAYSMCRYFGRSWWFTSSFCFH